MIVLIRRWAIFPTFLLFVVLGNSSSGGAVAPPLLPPPLAIVSEWLPSGATVTALREAVYFHGNQHVLPFAVLAVWAATWLGLMLVVSRPRGTSPEVPDPRSSKPPAAPSRTRRPALTRRGRSAVARGDHSSGRAGAAAIGPRLQRLTRGTSALVAPMLGPGHCEEHT